MYIVLEMQTGETTAIVPPVTYKDLNVAYQKYYTALASAAVSKVPLHTVMLLTDKGELMRTESFEHPTEETDEGE